MKDFKILHFILPYLWCYSDIVVQLCVAIVNLQNPLIKEVSGTDEFDKINFKLCSFSLQLSYKLTIFAILYGRFDYSNYAIREHSLIVGKTELEEIELGSVILLHAGIGV